MPWHRVPAVEKSSRYMHGRAVKSAGTVFRNTFLLLHHLPVIARPRAVGRCIRGAKLWRLPTRKRRQFPVFSPEIVEIQDFALLIGLWSLAFLGVLGIAKQKCTKTHPAANPNHTRSHFFDLGMPFAAAIVGRFVASSPTRMRSRTSSRIC